MTVLEERFELVKERIEAIQTGRETEMLPGPFRDYFEKLTEFCLLLIQKYDAIKDRDWNAVSAAELAQENQQLYYDVLPEYYADSYANPAVAAARLGWGHGQMLGFLYVELRSQIACVFEQKLEEFVIHLELMVEVYGAFLEKAQESRENRDSNTQENYTSGKALPGREYEACAPSIEELHEILYWFVSDYSEPMIEQRVREQVDPDCDFAVNIIQNADLSDSRYLYRYGEYITENQIRTAAFLETLPEETIALMADTYTEGYRMGFVLAKKDLSRKKTVNIRYSVGFERVIRKAIANFEAMGLKPTIYRAGTSIFAKRGVLMIGYYGAIANKQMNYDHKDDQALFLDNRLLQRKKEILKEAYEAVKELAYVHAGPACMEIFGEKQFEPVTCADALELTEKQQQLSVEYSAYSGELVNEYIKGEERSFTIIAFPVPEIGEHFEEIFAETIRINTLDYMKYQKIQQTIIDALDQAEAVEIEGMGVNRTKMRVQLQPITDAAHQTKFENCVADVNIPVGEVFTSPVLAGTEGVLHVSRVFLEELEYRDLEITFRDGKIVDYRCANFGTPEENRKYIRDNILFHHDTLPLGEFAIGTNTTAYVVAKKYQIFDQLPILIAEKMGPHFAVGDTCYSHSEDIPVYNPDGKEIIARDNEISLLRKTDSSKAYFNCHTDITIPYDELGSVTAVHADGSRTAIIQQGRFVLAGCEALNEPFEEKEE